MIGKIENKVIAQLNKLIEAGEIKESSQKYLDKFKDLTEMMNAQSKERSELVNKINEIDTNITKLDGALYLALTMMIEEEDLLPEPEISQ